MIRVSFLFKFQFDFSGRLVGIALRRDLDGGGFRWRVFFFHFFPFRFVIVSLVGKIEAEVDVLFGMSPFDR